MRWPEILSPPWRRWGVIAVASVLVILLCVRVFLMSPMARSIVESRLEGTSAQGQSVQIEALRGDLFGRLSVEALQVRDADGVWLDAEDLKLNWSPFALVFGRLEMESISAQSITVLRQPELEPSRTTSDGTFVKAYDLGALNIDTLSLADGIAGPAQEYEVAAGLKASGWTGDLSLSLVPKQGAGDKIIGEIEWGGDVFLSGQFEIDGAPNGLISKLIEAPENQAIAATLEGSGHMLEWSINARSQIGGQSVLDAELIFDRSGYQTKGQADFSSIGRLDAMRRRLGNVIEFNASISNQRAIAVDLVSERGEFELQGDLVGRASEEAIDNLRFEARDLDMPGLTGLSDLVINSISADGRLSRAETGVVFEGEIRAPQIAYQDYAIGEYASAGVYRVSNEALALTSAFGVSEVTGLPGVLEPFLRSGVSGAVEADYTFATSRAQIKNANLRGADVEVSAQGAYALGAPLSLAGEYSVQELSEFQTIVGTWSLNQDGSGSRSIALNGLASLSADAPETFKTLTPQMTFSADLLQAGNELTFRDVSFESEGLRVSLEGVLNEGQIELEGETIAQLSDIYSELSAPLIANARISGPVNAPTFYSKISGQALSEAFSAELNGQISREQISLEAATGSWRAFNATGAGQIDLRSPADSEFRLDLQGAVPGFATIDGTANYAAQTLSSQLSTRNARLGNTELEDATLQLSGTWPRFEGTLQYRAQTEAIGVAQPIRGDHALMLDASNSSLTVEGTTVLGASEFTVTSPIEICFGSALGLTGAMSAFGGDVSLSVDSSGADLTRIEVSNLEMGELGPLIQRPGLRGTVTGDLEVQLLETGLAGRAAINISEVMRAGVEGMSANVSLDARIAEDLWSMQVQAIDASDLVALEGTANGVLFHQGSLISARPAFTQPIPITILGEGEIGPLWALAAPLDLRLDGTFAIDVSNGDGRSLRFAGPVTITDGVFEDGITGARLEDLSMDMVLDPEQISVRSASARGSNGGTITASGAYNFNGDSNLELTLNRLRALRRADVSTTLSGSANVDRRDRRTHIQGDLVVDDMRVNLSNLPRAGYTTLDVRFQDDVEEEVDGPTREAISLDLGVRADRRIFVIGPSFESEWGIDAQISGSPGAPSLSGQATLIRGDANLLSRRFALSEGVLRFVGAPDQSEILLRAERDSDGVTTSIALVGPVFDPDIELGSDPSLPEDEVLARVLFGRSPSNLSPLQAAQLAGAAAQLAGGDAFSLTGQLQDATGLDVLDFGVSDDGQATLSTGKYLADDVYLEIESGGSGAPAVALEWTPLSNVEVDAEIDPELGPKVAVQWKRDFDRLPGEPGPD